MAETRVDIGTFIGVRGRVHLMEEVLHPLKRKRNLSNRKYYKYTNLWKYIFEIVGWILFGITALNKII